MLDREARIAQSFGGPYFELVGSGLAAIALWLWPHGFLAPVLFSFVVINYYVLLIDLTPMLELDGYFMLSDAIRRARPSSSIAGVRAPRPVGQAPPPRAVLVGRRRTVPVRNGRRRFHRLCSRVDVLVLAAHLRWPGRVALERGSSGSRCPRGACVVHRFTHHPRGGGARSGDCSSLRIWFQRARFRVQRNWRIDAAALVDALPSFDDLPVETLNDLAGRVERRRVGTGSVVVARAISLTPSTSCAQGRSTSPKRAPTERSVSCRHSAPGSPSA